MGFIDPEDMPQPHPDNVGIATVVCRCGGVSLSVSGVGATSILIGCPTCGEFSEALVDPYPTDPDGHLAPAPLLPEPSHSDTDGEADHPSSSDEREA